MQRKQTLSFKDELRHLRTLRRAWESINKSNLASHGISGETIASFGNRLETNLKRVGKELKADKFFFSRLRGVAILKKGSNDFRGLQIAEIRDRVIQKALAGILYRELCPLYNLENSASFAYIRTRGSKQAIAKICKGYSRGLHFALKVDIIKFFDEIVRTKLFDEFIFPNLKDSSINDILKDALNQEIGNWNELSEEQRANFPASGSGVPQGNALSPLLSNIYLAKFDEFIIASGFDLIRYADDLVVMCTTEEEAIRAYGIIKSYLLGLGLKVHPIEEGKKTKIVDMKKEPLEFLSVVTNGTHSWPSQGSVDNLTLRIKAICGIKSYTVLQILTQLNSSISGWLEAFSFTNNASKYFSYIDEYIDIQLDASLRLRNWKLKKTRSASTGKVTRLNELQREKSGVPLCQKQWDKIQKRIKRKEERAKTIPPLKLRATAKLR
jgi:RNA-directed DNA polymerase